MIEEFIEHSFKAGAALLTALKHRDAYTEAHCARVAHLAFYMGNKLGLSEDELACLVSASILHDIGKIGVSDDLLLKPNALVPIEFEVMKSHTIIGASIVEKLDIPTAAEVAQLVRWHHERIDGTGYPDGLKGDEIPIGARIISIVDAFDALTSFRVYRQGISTDQALEKLQQEANDRYGLGIMEALRQVLQEIDANAQQTIPIMFDVNAVTC